MTGVIRREGNKERKKEGRKERRTIKEAREDY
jgi:hypothetical protein